MQLTPNQLTQLFQKYLQWYFLPRSFNHLPLFEDTYFGGLVLTKRLLKILRDPEISYIYKDGKIDCEELIRVAKEKLGDKKIYLLGLNSWFSVEDLDILRDFYIKLFLE